MSVERSSTRASSLPRSASVLSTAKRSPAYEPTRPTSSLICSTSRMTAASAARVELTDLAALGFERGRTAIGVVEHLLDGGLAPAVEQRLEVPRDVGSGEVGIGRRRHERVASSAGAIQPLVGEYGASASGSACGMHHDQLLCGPGQGHVQEPQPRGVGAHELRRLDHDHAVELEPLGVRRARAPRRARRAPRPCRRPRRRRPCSATRSPCEPARGDHRQRPDLTGRPARLVGRPRTTSASGPAGTNRGGLPVDRTARPGRIPGAAAASTRSATSMISAGVR